MKKELLPAIAILICSCNGRGALKEKTNDHETPVTVEGFDWLLGNWERTNEKEGRQTYESWQKKHASEYRGVGFTLQGRDTIWKENIKLIKPGDNWNFEVTGTEAAEPVIFKVTKLESGKFTCENKENEFPKKITYMKEGNNIKAVISGGDMEIPFEFERINRK